MKKLHCTSAVLSGVASALLSLSRVEADVVFTENFNAYTPGNLVGQGSPPWTNLSATGTPNGPLQVVELAPGNNVVPIPTGGGPDDYRFFTTSVTPVNGQSLTTQFDVNVTAAASAGDLFAHLSTSTLSPASPFYNRFYARTPAASPAGTFQFGLSAGNPTAGAVYGADIPFGQHTVVSTWNFVPGALNDTFSMTVDGSQYIAEFSWNTAAVEPADIARFGLRQGGTSSPSISAIDNIVVNSVPEPSTAAAVAFAAGALLMRRRKSV